ncbi:putative signal-transduction protein with CBS domains [Alkaliphilus metalliredigens QYMF]|uniref:Putative signal-transduction protein with CBS domains n=1 Tax=Alkaliphilus metalliredigens (strain QYMF) TaxID=293826 RepID=A6TU98_ALKMQ|nr:CBS domain-containing protein [Alkaliphilus metalliredigens]ABR49766.1 putative signal-transduction protein with CBS domains [Alkaliphilus metalliredigens QYMF]
MKVKEVMTSQVSFAQQNSTVNEVAQIMKSLDIGSVPVCNQQNQPVGIVTDRDIVIRGLTAGLQATDTIERVMTQNLVSVSPETDIHEAARVMGENQIRRLPVVENGQIVGMLAIGDLAVKNIYVDEAGDALSEISTPSNLKNMK